MTNPTYAKAYTEVLEILNHFPEEEYDRIPIEKIEFYRKNMDKEYNFTINPEIDFEEQNISKEANAIIVNLFKEYFATDEQKVKIEEILKINQEKEEQQKREKYNPDDIFKKVQKQETSNVETIESQNALIEYKESFFIKFKNFIFRILHIKD